MPARVSPLAFVALVTFSMLGCQGSEMPFVGMDGQGRLEAVPTGDLQQLSDGLRAEVSAAVGVAYKQPVVARYASRAGVREELASSYRTQHGLGEGVPLGDEVAYEIEVMSKILLGYYDATDRHKLVVLDDLTPIDRVTVMRHELVHALQDQHWPLLPLQRAAEAAGPEAMLALRAVIEGQAKAVDGGVRTTQMHLPWNLRRDGSSLFGGATARASIDFRDQGAQPHDPVHELLAAEEGDTEPVLVELAPLLHNKQAEVENNLRMFPYVAGKAFIRALQQTAPLGQVVAMTLERPPTTTQQILHPALYLANAQPEELHTPALEAWFAAGPDADADADDSTAEERVPARKVFSIGEYLTAASLGGTAQAYAVAENLTGDRVLLRNGWTARGPVWTALWRNAAAAQAYRDAVAQIYAAMRADVLAQAVEHGLSREEALADFPAEEASIRCGRATVSAYNLDDSALPALRAAASADLSGYGPCTGAGL